MFLSELFEKKPSGNKPFKTLLTETLTLESVSWNSLRSGYDIQCDRKTEWRRPDSRLHCVRYRCRYLYFCQFPTESKRVPQDFFPSKSPCFSASTGSDWENSSIAVSHNSKRSIFSQKIPKLSPILLVARVQLKHNSSVTRPYRACNTRHEVSRAMESLPLTHLGKRYIMVCYKHV